MGDFKRPVTNLRKEDNVWHWTQKYFDYWLDDGIVHFNFEEGLPAFYCNGYIVQDDTGLVLYKDRMARHWVNASKFDCDADLDFGHGFDLRGY